MEEFVEDDAGGLAEESWSSIEGGRLLFLSIEPSDPELFEALEAEGAKPATEDSLERVARRVDAEEHDVVVFDVDAVPEELSSNPLSGAESDPVQILRVSSPTPESYRRVLDLGLDTFVRRDIGPESLLRIVEQELRARGPEADEAESAAKPAPILGESEAMERICRLIAGAAPSTAPALIAGESGVGKELVAQAIHRLSPRRRRPFVALNCGAIPENLIESELFGHEEGAFTGATSARTGRFEQADRGTLFLDEVGELPSEMQVKLLRVLEAQTFERVGGNERISVDVRVLSATNRDLTVDIERDRFRRDLFFRLNVLEIDVPPLREHREDIDVLWEYFVWRAASEEARPVPESTREVRRRVYRYDWPGNVREIRNVARHSVALSTGETLDVDHLPERFRDRFERQIHTNPGRIQVPGMTLEEVERATIIRTHEWTSSAVETAEMLGISERKVYYKLKEYREEGFLGNGEEGEDVESDRETTGSARPRVLVAEDDRQLQWSLRELLEGDYDVETVTTGRQLVEEVHQRKPDLILSDIRMPGLDGIQVLRERQTEKWDVPIVLITAFGDEENRAQAELLGAEAFLDKPVKAERLLQTLREALEGSTTGSPPQP